MSIEAVRSFFEQYQLDTRIQEFDASSATVELAAQALGVEGKRIAKTLSFLLGDSCILIVAAGDAKVDNRKFKDAFGTKAKLLPHDLVPQYTGHQVGGVCPFAVKEGVPVYLDVSLKRFSRVHTAGGVDTVTVCLTPRELEEHSRAAGWVDVCKGWQDEAVEQ